MMFRAWHLLVLLAALTGCATRHAGTVAPPRHFDFARDTFAFTNELVWAYETDTATGEQAWRRRDERPPYTHHCFVVVRSARQFWWHARFDEDAAAVAEETLRRRVRAVVRRRDSGPEPDRPPVVIPGFPDLRSLSAAHPALVQEACGGAWQSYRQRGHWRMILPFSRRGQSAEAERLRAKVVTGVPCAVHVVRFPSLTINHAVLLLGVRATSGGLVFTAYDPNAPHAPLELVFDRGQRRFLFPATRYFAGGPVNVYEVYRNWAY